MKKKVVIIGCGFAGAFASRYLSRFDKDTEITVIDKKKGFDFLPMLPDILGRNIPAEFLSYPIKLLSEEWGFCFLNEEAKSVDTQQNSVLTSKRRLDYDYLIISGGSETNFYGNNEIKKYAYKLDDVADAKIILGAMKEKGFDSILISGGGYTGVEVATSLRAYLNKRNLKKRITIIERGPSILSSLPEWIKGHVHNNLKELEIEVLTNTVLDKIDAMAVSLSSGDSFNNAMLVWVAGVRTPDFVQSLNVQKNPQGRIRVDEYLRLKDNCFVAGDCVYVEYKGSFLRMAVQFSIYQALSAAANIIKSIRSQEPVKYAPVDLGYIIPMANNKSCGAVMGLNVTGMNATMMHFIMCVYRSFGFKNKSGIIKSLITGGIK